MALPLLIAGTFVKAIADLGNAVTQAKALKAQGKMDEVNRVFNSNLLEQQAQQVLNRANIDSQAPIFEAQRIAGAQKAGYAAQGVNVNSGSPTQLAAETYQAGNQDAMTIRNNAYLEAWGYRSQAVQELYMGKESRRIADFNAKATLLTGGLQALGSGVGAIGAYNKA